MERSNAKFTPLHHEDDNDDDDDGDDDDIDDNGDDDDDNRDSIGDDDDNDDDGDDNGDHLTPSSPLWRAAREAKDIFPRENLSAFGSCLLDFGAI